MRQNAWLQTCRVVLYCTVQQAARCTLLGTLSGSEVVSGNPKASMGASKDAIPVSEAISPLLLVQPCEGDVQGHGADEGIILDLLA